MTEVPKNPKKSKGKEERIIALLKEWGWITKEQYRDCRLSQTKLKEMDMQQSILDIMLAKGYLNATQKNTVLEELGLKKRKGFSLPGFQIEKKIGEGGMGKVLLALKLDTNEQVAIKVLPLKMAKNESLKRRFILEAEATTRLNHPNLIRGYSVHQDEGYVYYVMEYVEGKDLGRMMHGGEYLQEKHALKITRQVALALQHAHVNHIIHRDVKPENILITKKGTVKLVDLGLAKDLADNESLTLTGMPIGSPKYISPEQARGSKNMDFRTDIYSLGATLYRMVVGCAPFTGDNSAMIMSKHISEPVTPPKQLNQEISTETNQLILKMMSKLPNNRHTDMEELIREIDRILNKHNPSSEKQKLSKTLSPDVQKQLKQHRPGETFIPTRPLEVPE